MITRETLHEEGWSLSQHEEIILEIERQRARGISDRAYLLKLLRRRFPLEDRRVGLRENSLTIREAVSASTREAEKNLRQVRRTMGELLRCPVIEAGAIMPDACPAGSQVASIPVGGVIAARNAIIPAAHGSDICCSMFATVFPKDEHTPAELLDKLMEVTRFGPGGRHESDWVFDAVTEEPVWENPFLRGLQRHAKMHMADQGDGNHFAFLGELNWTLDQAEQMHRAGYRDGVDQLAPGQYRVLVTHHGSRGLGDQLYRRGLEAAVRHTERVGREIPEAAAWLDAESAEGKAYWQALDYVSRWTRANHESIHRRYLDSVKLDGLWRIGNEHNFVWKRGDLYLHGKGATPAWKDDKGRPLLGLIPLNMAQPIQLVLGADREEYLSFCPHGAGRHLSRRALLRQFRSEEGGLDLELIQQTLCETTRGLDVRWFSGKADISETPVAYKEATEIRRQIVEYGLVEPLAEIVPLGCIMAGGRDAREEVLTPKQVRQMGHRADRRKERQSLRSKSWEASEE